MKHIKNCHPEEYRLMECRMWLTAERQNNWPIILERDNADQRFSFDERINVKYLPTHIAVQAMPHYLRHLKTRLPLKHPHQKSTLWHVKLMFYYFKLVIGNSSIHEDNFHFCNQNFAMRNLCVVILLVGKTVNRLVPGDI